MASGQLTTLICALAVNSVGPAFSIGSSIWTLRATGNFSVPYVNALLAATRPEMLVDPDKHKLVEGLTPEQVAKMEKEMEVLQRDLTLIEESHGNQVLNLVLARGYLAKLLGNARVARYLDQHHADIFRELQSLSESSSLEN